MRMSQFGVLVILIVIIGVAVTVGMLAVNAPDPLDDQLEPETEGRAAPRGPEKDTRPGVVAGEVRIFRTDEPAVDVTVRVEGDGDGGETRTDEKGFFRLRTPPGGRRTVVVEAPEPYAPVIVTGVTVEPGRSVSVGTLYLERAFLAKGVVVDGQGKPIGGAAVRVRRSMAEQNRGGLLDMFTGLGEERPPLEAVTANASGGFSFTKLSPGTFTFEAEAPGFAVGFRPSVIVAPETAARPIRIVLGPGEALEGTVKNAEDEPIAGARVTIVRIDEGMLLDLEFQPVQTVTDASGTFEFGNLAPGRAGVMVVAEGYPTRFDDEIDVGRQKRLDIVLSGTASIAGTVRDSDGRALAGADVTGFWQGKRGGLGRATTDADGNYRLDHLPEVSLILMVRKEGYASYPAGADMLSMFRGNQTKLTAGETFRKDVTLDSGSVVLGHVTDAASGRPVVGAEVRAVGASSFFTMGRAPGVLTDEEGAYRLAGVGRGKHLMMVKAKGYVQGGMGENAMQSLVIPFGGGSSSPNMVDVKGAGLEIRHDLTISPAARITGRVLTPDGKPVPAARVSLDTGDRNFLVFARFMGLGIEPVMTNEKGEFSLTSVAGDKPMKLRAEADGWVAGTSDPVSAASGTDVAGVTIRLGSPGTVEGVVVDAAGAPVKGATVRATLHGDGNQPWKAEQALMRATPDTTDDQGRFRLEGLAPGVTIVQAEAPEMVTNRAKDVQVTAGGVTSGVVVKLEKGQVIEGEVRDENGNGVSGVHVWISPDQRDAEMWLPGASNSAQTDRQGHFKVDRLAPGTYSVNVNSEEYIDETLSKIQAGTTGIVITLRRGKAIAGRVTLPDGQPAVGVQVSATAPNRGWESTMTDKDGEFRIDGLKDGEYELRIDTRGVAGFRGMRLKGVQAGTEGVELSLQPGFTISGVVVDANGEPASGTHVWASGWDGKRRRQDAPTSSAQTGESGQFTIGGLDAGQYRIQAVGVLGQGQNVVTAVGGSEGVRIVLPAPKSDDEGR